LHGASAELIDNPEIRAAYLGRLDRNVAFHASEMAGRVGGRPLLRRRNRSN